MPTGKRDEYLRKTWKWKQADDQELKRLAREASPPDLFGKVFGARSSTGSPSMDRQLKAGREHNKKYSPEKAYYFKGKK